MTNEERIKAMIGQMIIDRELMAAELADVKAKLEMFVPKPDENKPETE